MLKKLTVFFIASGVNHMWHSTGWFLWFFPPSDLATNLAGEGQGYFLGWLQLGLALWMFYLYKRLRHVPLGWTLSITVLILNKIWTREKLYSFCTGLTKYVSDWDFNWYASGSQSSEPGAAAWLTACTWQAEGPDVCMPTEEGKMGWMEARARMKTLTVCVRLEIRAWDRTPLMGANVALADGTGPHNSSGCKYASFVLLYTYSGWSIYDRTSLGAMGKCQWKNT